MIFYFDILGFCEFIVSNFGVFGTVLRYSIDIHGFCSHRHFIYGNSLYHIFDGLNSIVIGYVFYGFMIIRFFSGDRCLIFRLID